jgi:replicative DNA helicase
MTKQVKEIPNSKESEMMVLGCMLTKADELKHPSEELEESDFYYNEHKIIFQVLKAAFKSNKPADVHLVCEELKRQDKLKSVGGVAYITTLAQYPGTSAYVEEYVEKLKNKALLRSLISHSQEITNNAFDEPENANSLLEKFQNTFKKIEQRTSKKIALVSIEERQNQLTAMKNAHIGKKYLGLCVKTIEEFNENLLGLRKLNLLAAAPNVGKTALTIQLALEVLLTEPEACLAYFSLEMSSLEIFTRMNLYLAEMNFRNLIFGHQENANGKTEISYTKEEHERIEKAQEVLKKIGNRLQIIDTTKNPYIDSRSIINYVDNLKKITKCKRAIVIIDYLQVWPINPSLRFPSENEVDKWRMGEMKKIRDAMNEDPVIVISEARKPTGSNETWGGDLSDVMGSARGTYTPDVVMLLSQVRPKSLVKLFEKHNLPKDLEAGDELECNEDEKPGMIIKNFLAKHGIAICKLDVPKARDGMHKFNILLEFYFHKNTFKKINWNQIKELIKNSTFKKKNHLTF